MKKLQAFIIAAVMLITGISASAQSLLSFQDMFNYSADSVVSVSFSGGNELLTLLKEMEMLDRIEYFVDIETLVDTLLSSTSEMKIQADISRDLKKGKIAINSTDSRFVSVNPNLNIDVDSKSGLWLCYDLTNLEVPVFEMVISAPTYNKYIYIDLVDCLNEDDREMFNSYAEKIFDKDFTEKVNLFAVECLENYSEVTSSGSKVTVKIDNEALRNIIKEYFSFFKKEFLLFDETETSERLDDLDLFESLNVLGDGGIVVEYTIKNGKLIDEKFNADISFSVADLYTATATEEEAWEYVSEGRMSCSINSETKYYDIDRTIVELPALNEENSISYKELIPEYYYEDYESGTQDYPVWWIGGETEKLFVIGEKTYFPFREVMEKAYEDTVNISYDNGTVAVSSDYFNDFDSITFSVGSDKAYVDDAEKYIGTVINDGGKVFVSQDFFTEVMHWDIDSAKYDIKNNTYYYTIYSWDDFIDEEETKIEYPLYYVCVYPEKLPAINGDMYVPLREVLEAGYEDSVSIAYNKGVITAESEFFPGFKTMKLTVGSDKILLDSEEKTLTPVINDGGKVYVNVRLFTEIFGWELDEATHSLLLKQYMCDFYTSKE